MLNGRVIIIHLIVGYYKTFKELFKGLYYKKCTIDEAEREQDEFNAIIGVFEDYTPKNNKYIEAKN